MNRLVLDVAIRAWAIADYLNGEDRKDGKTYVDLGPSDWSLAFDTETLVGLSQKLRIVTWQFRKKGRLRRAGIAYEPANLSPEEVWTIYEYAKEHSLRVMTREQFVEWVFYDVTWKKRGFVVGSVNLVFDLTRLAVDHYKPHPPHKKRSMRGGFCLVLSPKESRPNIQIKRITGRAAFIRFVTPEGRHPESRNREKGGSVANHEGYFVDVGVLGGALLGRKLSLRRLADTLGTKTKKLQVAGHGRRITPEYLDYAMADTQVSWECFEKLRQRYESLDLDAPIYNVISEASVGKAYLKKLGIKPWRKSQRRFPNWILAAALEAYYGGRSECHIRLTPMPGVATDITSEYPTVFVLMALWHFLIAKGVRWGDEDPDTTMTHLEGLRVEHLLNPDLWRGLTTLVLIEPVHDLLPTRAPYGGGSVYNLGINWRVDGPPQWWTLADVMVSVLETGRVPRIRRTLRFYPLEPQEGLDPKCVEADLVRQLVEQKAELAAKAKKASGASASLLDAQTQATKATVNSLYGMCIETNVVEHWRGVPLSVYRSDETDYPNKQRRVGEPGSFFHPLLATFVAGAGRLLLELVIRMVTEAGGTYVFCDTDSVFIVATKTGGLVPCEGGPHFLDDGREAVQALSWSQVEAIVERLRSLNPYSGHLADQSILKLEAENFDPETGEQWEIECMSIAAKRYAPFRRGADGRPHLIGPRNKRKRSEHGLGHLLSPTQPDPDAEDPGWFDRWWEHLLCKELGVEDPEPGWFDDAAVGRLTVTSPREESNFKAFNAKRPYTDRIRPSNFLMMVYPKTFERLREGSPQSLVAPYESDPQRRVRMRWLNRDSSGGWFRIRTEDSEYVVDGSVPVASYRDVFDEYRTHREAKSAGPDVKQCTEWTSGLLQPLEVSVDRIVRIGKEANRLSEDDVADEPEDRVIEYPEPTCKWCGKALTGRQKDWCSEACRKRWKRWQAKGAIRNDISDRGKSARGAYPIAIVPERM